MGNELLAVAVFVFVLIFFYGVKVFRFGGFKGALFRAKVERCFGELKIDRGPDARFTIALYRLESGDRDIGLEVVLKTTIGKTTIPVAMTQNELKELMSLLSVSAGVA